MRRLALAFCLIAAIPVAALGYTKAMRGQHGTPPAMAGATKQADFAFDKPARALCPARGAEVIREIWPLVPDGTPIEITG